MKEPSDADILHFLETIRVSSSYDFSDYSINSLKRRILKLQNDHQLELKELSEKIGRDHNFSEVVARRITVNTTELFRDPKTWIDLKGIFLDKISPLDGKKLSVWHCGCSTGQEVYSMLMLLDNMDLLHNSEVLATDLNTDALNVAMKGKYKYRFNIEYAENFSRVINEGKSPEKNTPIENYCFIDKVGDYYQMRSFLTEKPIFRKFDLVHEDFEENQFDLIFCRNVIIYFNIELQERVLQLLHKALKPGGCLVLGRHESIVGRLSRLFDKKQQFYFKKYPER